MTEIGEILNLEQCQALNSNSIYTREDVRAQSDEQLLLVPGIGPAALKKLRKITKLPEQVKGDAISSGYMVIRKGGKTLNVAPGDVIPAEYDAETRVAQGKARWRNPSDV